MNQTSGSRARSSPRVSSLSRREREILGALAAGYSGAQIAERLFLSPETVRTHIRNAMVKLGAATRAQAVAMALQSGEIGNGVRSQGEDAVTADADEDVSGSRSAQAADRTPKGLGPDELERVLSDLLADIVELPDIESGTAFVAEDGGLELRLGAHVETAKTSSRPPATLALGKGPVGRSALKRRPQVVPDFHPSPSAPRAMIAAPMVSGGRLAGILCLSTRPSRPVDRDEMLLVAALSNRVAEFVLKGGREAPGRVRDATESFRSSWAAASVS
jgi:DNA-binding CsgD family transcriptional regulator